MRPAYRTLGADTGEPPLVFLQHFTGTMDDWDPEVVEGLARGRRIYVFDNAGVGASEGVTPDSIERMARYAEGFVDALELETVDLLPDPPASEATAAAQIKAIMTWAGAPADNARLAAIKQPVLIVNGSNDVMAPTPASYDLYQRIPQAQLVRYPDSGHAALFQYHDAFVREVDTFLRSSL